MIVNETTLHKRPNDNEYNFLHWDGFMIPIMSLFIELKILYEHWFVVEYCDFEMYFYFM